MSSKVLQIPSDSFALETELKQKKSKYIEHIYKTFKEHFIDNKITATKLNIYKFRGTSLVVILKNTQYKTNLENILDYYIEEEEYEKCELIKNILASLKITKDIDDNTAST